MEPKPIKRSKLQDLLGTIIGALIILVDVVLFVRHVWHGVGLGDTDKMGWMEWAIFLVLLSLGAFLMGYRFNAANYLPDSILSKIKR